MGKTRHYYASQFYEEERAVTLEMSAPDIQPDAPHGVPDTWAQWEQDCHKWRGMVLHGRYTHWCANWDGLPMDETCPEWPCRCGIEQDVDGSTDIA